MPPAPPTFSITIAWPRISAIRAATMRPATSIELPAVNETIMVIGLLGQFCACAGDSSASAVPIAAQRVLTILLSSSRVAALFGGDARAPDWNGPFLDLGLDKLLQIVRRAPLARNGGDADLAQPLAHRRRIDGGACGLVELLHDRGGRALGQEEAVPGPGVEIGDALFEDACEIRQDRRALLRQHRDRLDLSALDLRSRRGAERAHV